MGRDIKAKHSPAQKPHSRPMPVFLQQAREHALGALQAHLVQAVAHCDDVFFDLSSKASSNSEQNIYFEAMREVRSQKELILTNYHQQLTRYFDDLLLAKPRHGPLESSPQDNLSLVGEDDVEQDVALSSMISKGRANNQEALYHLKCRFEKLLPGIDISDQNNPLDPGALCQAFRAATAELDLEIKARIVLFKQYDREVIAKLPQVYDDVNQLLINSGVLPEIKSTIKKQASGSIPHSNTAAQPTLQTDTSGAPAPHYYGLPELSTLLGGLRRLNVQPASFIPRYSARSGPVVSQDELVRLLAELQASISYEEILHQQALDIRSAIERIMSSMDESGSADHALETPDEDVINLVAMFFDFVLSDPSLPMSFQALIARLQLPILKLALRDADFFNTNRHPARMLINEIARLGVGFDESAADSKDLVVKTIEEIIQSIHDQPEADTSVFEAMRDKLQQIASREEQKAERVEKRAREMACGQAKTQAARNRVQRELHQRLKDTTLPESISKFLIEDWQNVLLLTNLKQGEDSAEWLEALQVVDDLIWSVHDHQDGKSQARRVRLLPGLRDNIRRGLQKTVANDADMEAIVAIVDRIHHSLTEGRIEDLQYDALQPEQEAALQQTDSKKSWKEMTAVERQQAKYKRITYDYIRKADALQTGTWMLFSDPTSGKTLRCKLSAKLEETDTYVFVNRFGFKMLEKKRKEVAHDMQLKRAMIIDNGPLFDRAFARIAESLRDLGQVATS